MVKSKNKITSAAVVLRGTAVSTINRKKNVNNLKVNRRIITKHTMRALPDDSDGGMAC